VTEVQYIFGDAITGRVIDEIPLTGVTVGEGLDGGELQGTFGLNMTGRNNSDLYGATQPGKCFVVAERNGTPFWGGMIWSRTYQSQAESVQLFAKTFGEYPSKRVIDHDLTYTSMDPRNIFRALWLDMQSYPYTINIDIPATVTPTSTMDYTVAGSELKRYRACMDELSQSDNGFEWRVAWTRINGNYIRTLQIGTPYLGQGINGVTNPVFEYPGNILNFWRNDTIAQSGTNIYGVGAGEGSSMLLSKFVHADLLAYGWPRLDTQTSRKDLSSQSLLNSYTSKQADILKAPSGIYTVQLKADRDPAFGEWSIGDYCTLNLTSGMGKIRYSPRIIDYSYTPPESDNAEEVSLTFEGDDLA
jgi:hypothetical protein